MSSIPGLIHTNLVGGVYVKSAEESMAAIHSAHGCVSIQLQIAARYFLAGQQNCADFFEGDEAAVDHFIEAKSFLTSAYFVVHLSLYKTIFRVRELAPAFLFQGSHLRPC